MWCAAAAGPGSPGTAHVVSVSEPPASSVFGRCELQLIVAAPGLQASRIKIRDPRVPVAKWPDAGATLPVMVAVDDMRHVRIQWDDVMTHTEAMAEPQMYADPMRDLGVDDLLPEPEAPPWVTRDRQQRPRAGGGDADPVTADLTGQLGDLRERTTTVREAAAKPIVLEGTLVDTEARSTTLPRRAKPSPYPRTAADSAAPTTAAPSTADAAVHRRGPVHRRRPAYRRRAAYRRRPVPPTPRRLARPLLRRLPQLRTREPMPRRLRNRRAPGPRRHPISQPQTAPGPRTLVIWPDRSGAGPGARRDRLHDAADPGLIRGRLARGVA